MCSQRWHSPSLHKCLKRHNRRNCIQYDYSSVIYENANSKQFDRTLQRCFECTDNHSNYFTKLDGLRLQSMEQWQSHTRIGVFKLLVLKMNSSIIALLQQTNSQLTGHRRYSRVFWKMCCHSWISLALFKVRMISNKLLRLQPPMRTWSLEANLTWFGVLVVVIYYSSQAFVRPCLSVFEEEVFFCFYACGTAHFPASLSVFAHICARRAVPQIWHGNANTHVHTGQTCVVMETHADVDKRGSRVNTVCLLSSRVQFISM